MLSTNSFMGQSGLKIPSSLSAMVQQGGQLDKQSNYKQWEILIVTSVFDFYERVARLSTTHFQSFSGCTPSKCAHAHE